MSKYTYRALDITVAFLLLPIVLPFTLILLLLVYLNDFHNPIFAQRRLGSNKREFLLLKIRSMRNNAEATTGEVWAASDDPRVTQIGYVLRKYRLDELPQLINILMGHMSFVGPRPIRNSMANKIAEFDNLYDRRFQVKPGLTGLAQLFAPYGVDISEQLQKGPLDRMWVEQPSVKLYFQIIYWTVLKIFAPARLIEVKPLLKF